MLFSWDGNRGNSWIWKFDFFSFLVLSFFGNQTEFGGEIYIYFLIFLGINYFECSSVLLEVNFQEFSGKFDFLEGFLV